MMGLRDGLTFNRTHFFDYFRYGIVCVCAIYLSACASGGANARFKKPKGEGPVSTTVRNQSSQLEKCMNESISLNSGEPMQMILTFVINPNGKPSKIDVEKMSSPDPDFAECIVRKMKKLQFPEPEDGKEHAVRYPLIFNQTDDRSG